MSSQIYFDDVYDILQNCPVQTIRSSNNHPTQPAHPSLAVINDARIKALKLVTLDSGNGNNVHYKCKSCQQIIDDEATAIQHVRENHIIIYRCDVCGRQFGNRHNLNRHVLIKHKSEDQYRVVFQKSTERSRKRAEMRFLTKKDPQ